MFTVFVTMFTQSILLTALLFLPLGVFSTPAPDPVAQVTAQQTIVPFSSLPACAAKCGPLYDAQGACSPPVVPASSTSCFCAYSTLQAFRSGTTGVCDAACPQDPQGLTNIRTWFLGLCGAGTATSTTATSSAATSTTTAAATGAGSAGDSGSGSSSGSSATTGNQTWLSTHYQYVIMLVVIVVAIVVGWVAACIFKKRYDQRKEREYELRPPAAPWLSGQPGARKEAYANGALNGLAAEGHHKETVGNAWATPANAVRFQSEKKEKDKRKKWVVRERT